MFPAKLIDADLDICEACLFSPEMRYNPYRCNMASYHAIQALEKMLKNKYMELSGETALITHNIVEILEDIKQYIPEYSAEHPHIAKYAHKYSFVNNERYDACPDNPKRAFAVYKVACGLYKESFGRDHTQVRERRNSKEEIDL